MIRAPAAGGIGFRAVWQIISWRVNGMIEQKARSVGDFRIAIAKGGLALHRRR
ncbi:hypothetical protein [Novosphingobium marinum]|uniref:hypothetical protein n=1 Tax=Novosphingobium marinum TaxID=1514948 RepID=UPI00166469C2|nr:hypothetical protein [Novosphingobium marinum]